MKKNRHECAFHGDPTASDEFWKDLFRVRPLENAEKGKALQLHGVKWIPEGCTSTANRKTKRKIWR